MSDIDRMLVAMGAELDVCFDTLMRAGWPASRVRRHRHSTFELFDAETITIILMPGIEFGAEMPVFQVVCAIALGEMTVHGTWLVDPIPTPHPSTIERGNIEAREAARE